MKNNFQKVPLLVSLSLLIFFSVVFVFLYKQIRVKTLQAEEDTKAWQIETFRREDIKRLNNSLSKIENDRRELETHFAKSSDVVPFLDTLEKLAPLAGAKAAVDSVDAAVDKTTLTVGLKASGSFEAIYKFLTLLENSPYELEFLSMDMRKIAGGGDIGEDGKVYTWEATFRIKLLSYIP